MTRPRLAGTGNPPHASGSVAQTRFRCVASFAGPSWTSYYPLTRMRSAPLNAGQFDPRKRAAEKAARREADEEFYRCGRKSAEQLREEDNAPFSKVKFRIDFEHAKRVR